MLKVEVAKLTHFVDTFLLKYISNSLRKWNDQNDPGTSELFTYVLVQRGRKKAQRALDSYVFS